MRSPHVFNNKINLENMIDCFEPRFNMHQQLTGLPAKLVVVVGVLEPGGVLEDLPDASDKLVEELSPLGVVEQRAADGRNLRKKERGAFLPSAKP